MKRRDILSVGVSTILGGCIGSRSAHPTSTAARTFENDQWRLDFSQWYAVESIPYYDSESERVEKLEPERDWWIEASTNLTYLPDGSAEPPNAGDFVMKNGENGKLREPMTSIPEVSWESVRFEDPHRMYWIEPGWLGPRTVEGGNNVRLYTLYDMNETDMPRIEYQHENGKVDLKPEFGLLPEGGNITH